MHEHTSHSPSSALVGTPAPGLHVIGAGFGRTGTLSLREALTQLGFDPCDHMLENVEHPERFALWREALRRKQAGEPIDWRPLLTGYRAIVDWPGAYFWRELTAAHPEAKVILTVRDPERWYESTLATIFSISDRAARRDSLSARVNMLLTRLMMPGMRDGVRLIDDVIWQGTFDGRFTDRDYALGVFNTHNQAVQEAIDPDRLLVFDVKQGWEPLCQFLDVPVPAGEPFPHLNDTATMQMQMQERYRGMAVRAGGIAAVAVAGLMALVWLGRQVRRGNAAAKP